MTLSSGIEILEGLHTLAVDIVSNFNSRGRNKLRALGFESHTICNAYHGDMLNLRYKDWRNADVVFANSTCFDEILMLRIADIARMRIIIYTVYMYFKLMIMWTVDLYRGNETWLLLHHLYTARCHRSISSF